MCGVPASSTSIIWELVRNVNSWAPPRSTESETLGVGPRNLGFHKLSRDFSGMLKFEHHTKGTSETHVPLETKLGRRQGGQVIV